MFLLLLADDADSVRGADHDAYPNATAYDDAANNTDAAAYAGY